MPTPIDAHIEEAAHHRSLHVVHLDAAHRVALFRIFFGAIWAIDAWFKWLPGVHPQRPRRRHGRRAGPTRLAPLVVYMTAAPMSVEPEPYGPPKPSATPQMPTLTMPPRM
jgi:hypothetical protein